MNFIYLILLNSYRRLIYNIKSNIIYILIKIGIYLNNLNKTRNLGYINIIKI